MREIKFRAWNVDGEVMLYSDFNAYGFYVKEDPDNIAEQTETIFMYHAHTGDKDFVLMQYTGLKDKNGVEIYEGDVVDMVSMFPGGVTLRGEVQMMEGSFTLVDARQGFATHLFNELSTIEVIGNIHEHPHLLEEAK